MPARWLGLVMLTASWSARADPRGRASAAKILLPWGPPARLEVAENPPGRPVIVTYKSGTVVSGTVAAEETAALVIVCDLGRLSIPRDRILTIAYDGATVAAATPDPDEGRVFKRRKGWFLEVE